MKNTFDQDINEVNLKNWKKWKGVEQFRISWKKVDENGAHLVAKGFEEPEGVPIDFPIYGFAQLCQGQAKRKWNQWKWFLKIVRTIELWFWSMPVLWGFTTGGKGYCWYQVCSKLKYITCVYLVNIFFIFFLCVLLLCMCCSKYVINLLLISAPDVSCAEFIDC